MRLVITGVSPQLAARFRRANFELDDPVLKIFPDLDHGLEWCENEIIASQNATTGPFGPVTGMLSRFRDGPMQSYLEPVTFRAGEIIVRQDDLGDALFIVDSGQLSVFLRTDAKPGTIGYSRRLRTYGVGNRRRRDGPLHGRTAER